MTVLFQKLNPAACLPRHATLGSAGYDLCACIEQPLTVKPGQTVPVPTGLAMALPKVACRGRQAAGFSFWNKTVMGILPLFYLVRRQMR